LERNQRKNSRSNSEKKKIPYSRFIYALGIRNVGQKTAFDLSRHFSSIEDLAKASLSELEEIKDIGSVVAQSIFNWFRDKANLAF